MRHACIVVMSSLTAIGIVACGDERPATTTRSGDRYLRLGEDALLLGDGRWAYGIAGPARPSFIVGDGVELVRCATDHLVVRLDTNLTVNVPTNGHHRVLLVDETGFRSVDLGSGAPATISTLSLRKLLQQVMRNASSPVQPVAVGEHEETAALVPFPLCLRRLGAPDGGAWTGPTRGGRILLWLGNSDGEEFDCLLAVLQNEKQPLMFGVFNLDVRSSGELSMGLAPVARNDEGAIEVVGVSPRIYVLAAVQGSVIRIRDTVGDDQGLFRAGTEMRRCSKQDQEETRRTVQESIK